MPGNTSELQSQLVKTYQQQVHATRVRQLQGLLFRRFGLASSCETLRRHYASYVRPRLEYAAPLWDPYTQMDIAHIDQFRDLLVGFA